MTFYPQRGDPEPVRTLALHPRIEDKIMDFTIPAHVEDYRARIA
ncbi:MAG: hypothetical protein AB3N23_05215 [Paracoccaceae bacterium]